MRGLVPQQEPAMNYPEFLENARRRSRALAHAVPEAMKGFAGLSRAVKDSGALGLKEKEFVALGISVAVRCEDCIAFHVEALMKSGASREELADVLGMAIQMGGGPAVMYAGHALECWDQLAAEKAG
jgi:AhpD family alkylhydroperoxidase